MVDLALDTFADGTDHEVLLLVVVALGLVLGLYAQDLDELLAFPGIRTS